MEKIHLSFKKSTPVLSPLLKALTLPRKGLRPGEMLPKIEVELSDARVNKKLLQDYNRVCGLLDSIYLPPLYPHVMAGTAHLNLLTHPKFPIKLLGAIHKYNVITQHKSLPVDETYQIKAWVGEQRFFEKGVEFDLDTQVYAQGELVWSETSTYLKRGNFPQYAGVEGEEFLSKIDELRSISSWKLDKNIGLSYAKISKDFNPIHVSSTMAKAFGFKGHLAHGFCVLAGALGKMERSWEGQWNLKVYFKGPSYLPGEVTLFQDGKNQARFDAYIKDNDRPVISLEIT